MENMQGVETRNATVLTPLLMRLWYSDFEVIQAIAKYSNFKITVLLWRGCVATLLMSAQYRWHVVELLLVHVVMFHGRWQNHGMLFSNKH